MRKIFLFLMLVCLPCLVQDAGAWSWGGQEKKEAAAAKRSAKKDLSKPSQDVIPKEPPVVQPPAPVVESAPEVSPITQAAVQSGALSCTSRINQIATFLTRNASSGAFLFTSPQQPAQHVFSASLEILPAANVPSMYASASFVPNPLGGCDAAYDTVEYVDQTCPTLGAQLFKGAVPGVIKKDILLYTTGEVRFFLMPAGKGCVVIKKEVLQ